MPLVDITTREGWHADADQSVSHRLGQGLPGAFIAEEKKLRLDPGTPEDAVQVDFHEYHKRAVNAADMWVLVRFTEDGLTKAEQNEVRDTVEKIVEHLLDVYEREYEETAGVLEPDDPWLRAMQNRRPQVAIDCFWGPGAGCIIFRDGRPTLYW